MWEDAAKHLEVREALKALRDQMNKQQEVVYYTYRPETYRDWDSSLTKNFKASQWASRDTANSVDRFKEADEARKKRLDELKE